MSAHDASIDRHDDDLDDHLETRPGPVREADPQDLPAGHAGEREDHLTEDTGAGTRTETRADRGSDARSGSESDPRTDETRGAAAGIGGRESARENDLDTQVKLLHRHLAEKYRGTFDADEVGGAIQQARGELEQGASRTEFLPIFIQRRTHTLLRDRAGERGLDLDQVEQILFLDEADTGLAQIAASMANGQREGLVQARSAGVNPGDRVQENVAELLRRRGADPEADEVSGLTGKAALVADIVVTMGLSDELKAEMPTHGHHQIDWDDLQQVGDESPEQLDQLAQEIQRRVDELVNDLVEDRVGDHQADPEAEREIEQVLTELREGKEG